MNVEQLVKIIPLLNCDPRSAQKIGREKGLSRHDVQSIRHILGFSEKKLGGKLTAEQRDEIAREYAEGGVSMNELARNHGVAYNSVRCILLSRDVTITNPRLWTKRQELYLLNELKRGKPTRQIADEIGKAHRCILQKIKRMKRDGIIKEGN